MMKLLLSKYLYRIVLVCLLPFVAQAQELYILNEPASNIPKGALGVRLIHMHYPNEQPNSTDRFRLMHALRLAYGISGRWMLWVQPAFSNHHSLELPPDLVNHYHIGTQTVFYSSNPQQVVPYPYRYAGTHFYTKYLFLKHDERNDHFRAAIYAEYSTANNPHEEAEANLYDDTGGWGAGLVITKLYHRWALSYTTGVIVPHPYEGTSGGLPTRMEYGVAWKYNLSLGYLLAPRVYRDYHQNNTNLYVELMGKQYPAARIIQDGERIPASSELHIGQYYWEVYAGIQKIVNSNTRIEITIGAPLYRRSYIHNYPVVQIQLQHYFFP
ncbi:hypothetical protein FHS56_002180 [Thermonema lapsum]|uniref:MetA-pathway of phenol degradation n=1 Tax=Thermonema lapsum TaxID=28195 RepID=A0A846MT93_9BACT|nr:hypothetical protein [Thermonema lapsum]NIK74651.1 hypothetical protein [Thermonema lapsum]